MRMVFFGLVSLTLASAAFGSETAAPKADERYLCSWGAGTAARAQELKLSGVSLYAARQKIQTYKFDKGWMRMLAMNITEQTYDSRSRFKPQAVREVFYKDCVNYKVARRHPSGAHVVTNRAVAYSKGSVH